MFGLPEGWGSAIDKASGRTYFFNNLTGETSWTCPSSIAQLVAQPVAPIAQQVSPIAPNIPASELPEGWEALRDASGRMYFQDHNTRTTSYKDPRSACSPVQPSSVYPKIPERKEMFGLLKQTPQPQAPQGPHPTPVQLYQGSHPIQVQLRQGGLAPVAVAGTVVTDNVASPEMCSAELDTQANMRVAATQEDMRTGLIGKYVRVVGMGDGQVLDFLPALMGLGSGRHSIIFGSNISKVKLLRNNNGGIPFEILTAATPDTHPSKAGEQAVPNANPNQPAQPAQASHQQVVNATSTSTTQPQVPPGPSLVVDSRSLEGQINRLKKIVIILTSQACLHSHSLFQYSCWRHCLAPSCFNYDYLIGIVSRRCIISAKARLKKQESR
jgi:hypothetical protein